MDEESSVTIVDFYKYAHFATAAYVRAGLLSPLDPEYQSKFATLARDQARLPLSIAQYLFAPTDEFPNPDVWRILQYYGSDNTNDSIAKADRSGFAATLFQQGTEGEKVLAIRGTEPFADPVDPRTGSDQCNVLS
jgi:hypothetical protein